MKERRNKRTPEYPCTSISILGRVPSLHTCSKFLVSLLTSSSRPYNFWDTCFECECGVEEAPRSEEGNLKMHSEILRASNEI